MFRFPEYARRQPPEVMIANASEKFDGQGKLTDEKAHNLIRLLLEALVALANSRELTNFRLRHVRRAPVLLPCRLRSLRVTAPGWPSSSAGDVNAQLR